MITLVLMKARFSKEKLETFIHKNIHVELSQKMPPFTCINELILGRLFFIASKA